MNRRDFLKTTCCLAVASALPAVAAQEQLNKSGMVMLMDAARARADVDDHYVLFVHPSIEAEMRDFMRCEGLVDATLVVQARLP